jgi:LuxR family maltose regulon positive regulatory protein
MLIAQHRARQPNTIDAALTRLNHLVAAADSAVRGGSLVDALVVRALGQLGHDDPGQALTDLGRALVGVAERERVTPRPARRRPMATRQRSHA